MAKLVAKDVGHEGGVLESQVIDPELELAAGVVFIREEAAGVVRMRVAWLVDELEDGRLIVGHLLKGDDVELVPLPGGLVESAHREVATAGAGTVGMVEKAVTLDVVGNDRAHSPAGDAVAAVIQHQFDRTGVGTVVVRLGSAQRSWRDLAGETGLARLGWQLRRGPDDHLGRVDKRGDRPCLGLGDWPRFS